MLAIWLLAIWLPARWRRLKQRLAGLDGAARSRAAGPGAGGGVQRDGAGKVPERLADLTEQEITDADFEEIP